MMSSTFAYTLIFALQVFAAQQPAGDARVSSQASHPKIESTDQETANSSSVLTVTQDGLLTLNARREPLGQLLGEFGRRAKLSIIVDDDIANNRISIQLQKVPLIDGLAEILSAYDAFYLYSADRSAPAVISTVWVYARGAGRDVEPVPASRWASSRELAERLNDQDEAVRARSYEALLERQGGDGLDTVLKALTDTSPQVREIGLSAAVDAEIEVPSSELMRLIQADPSPSVRFLAVEAAEQGSDAAFIAEIAQRDDNEHVRAYAAQVLRRLETKKGPGW